MLHSDFSFNTSRGQHGRPTPSEPPHTKPYFEVLWFSALLEVRAAVVNLFVLNLVCFISVCPCIPETGRLENTYSCCGFWLWSWLAAVVNLFVLNLLRFISVCLYPKRADCRTHARTKKKQKRPCPAVQGTWLHVGPFLAGVLTQRFSMQPLELYIPRLSRCTTQWVVSCSGYLYVDESLKTPVPVYTHTDLNVETLRLHSLCNSLLLLPCLMMYYYNVFVFAFSLVSLHGDECKCTV